MGNERMKGNQYYKLRSKHGRDSKYTPDTLREKFNEYVEWVLENPLKEEQIISRPWVEYVDDGEGGQKKVGHSHKVIQVNKMRPFTIRGFANFAEISKQTFLTYEKKKDFLDVVSRIRGIIENQQIEGASAGFLNHNIIARLVGLVDKKEVKQDRRTTQYTPKQRRALIKRMNKKKNSDEMAN